MNSFETPRIKIWIESNVWVNLVKIVLEVDEQMNNRMSEYKKSIDDEVTCCVVDAFVCSWTTEHKSIVITSTHGCWTIGSIIKKKKVI